MPMKRNVLWLGVIVLALVVSFYAGVNAAAKSYQFTGTVKSADGGTLVVEKTAKEVWTFSTDSSTKGTAKVGDKVTVYYKMVATEIEAKAATTKKK
jgi:predicted membrane-bound dolichyl-phosphate-mannose-protein mannosyltransferase